MLNAVIPVSLPHSFHSLILAAPYINSSITRFAVPDDKVKWSVPWKEYAPVEYTDPSINGKQWADPSTTEGIKFNEEDGKIDRRSFECKYAFDEKLRPLNPKGRTGLTGRGILGRWGPNHAADPIVSRIREGNLEFVAIKRKDTGEWAIPGGMVDSGEHVSVTLKREFGEEALGGKRAEEMDELWKNGKQLYAGYVDDHRNTDNAWMETVVYNFHDDKGITNNVKFEAGDDACSVRWVNVSSNDPLYASHESFIDLLKKHHT